MDNSKASRAGGGWLRAAVATSADGIVCLDEDGQVLAANPAACRLLGCDEESLRGLREGALLAADDAARAFAAVWRTEGHATAELSLRRADGSAFPAWVRSVRFVDPEGGAGRLLLFRDLGADRAREREQAETLHALREAEELFRLTIEHAPIGMALVGLDGRFLRVNERLCEIVGYPASELTALRFQDITHPEDLEEDLGYMGRLLSGEIPRYELSKRYLRKDGAVVDAVLHGSILRARSGEPRLFIAQIQDVTERRRLELQVAVADRMASLGTLAGGIAHEINNPLSYVLLNLEMAREDLKRVQGRDAPGVLEDVVEMLGQAHSGASRVREIVRELRSFGRAETERFEWVDVREPIEAAIRLVENEIRHRARLVVQLGTVPKVHADESRLVQVFVNLLANAAHAIPEGHAEDNEIHVTSRSEPASGHVVVEVQDTGPGIEPRVLARIFEPFFSTKNAGIGMGLGLAISHAIVDKAGGRIEVESRPGSGSLFRVVLPGAREEVAPGPPAGPQAGRSSVPGGHVLVIDDDARVAKALRLALERDHEVEVALGGRDAVERFAAGKRFDVVLCDLMMPDLGGPEVYRQVEALAPDQAKRFVFISGGAFTESARRFVDSVPNPCLEKPFEASELRERIAAVRAASDRAA